MRIRSVLVTSPGGDTLPVLCVTLKNWEWPGDEATKEWQVLVAHPVCTLRTKVFVGHCFNVISNKQTHLQLVGPVINLACTTATQVILREWRIRAYKVGA